MKPLDNTYGSWTVIGEIEVSKKQCGTNDYKVLCRCKCGIEKLVRITDLRLGKSVQCRYCSVRRPRPNSHRLRASSYGDHIAIGDKFAHWEVIALPIRCVSKRDRHSYYQVCCRCTCGIERPVLLSNLRNGVSQSCGCTKKRSAEWKRLKHIWLAIIKRCYNPSDDAYQYYGARGITLCEEWRTDFESFVTWCLANGSKKGLQIDRSDNNKGYSPENCRFVTGKVNCRNTRRNVLITAFGETKCIAEWGEDHRCVCAPNTLYHRFFEYDLTPEEALTMPCESGIAFEKRKPLSPDSRRTEELNPAA